MHTDDHGYKDRCDTTNDCDYQALNQHIKHETHHVPYPFDIISNVPLQSYKTVADAWDGYHQVQLDEKSSMLTTFITKHGRFRYLRSPQGLKSSGDAYTLRFDEILVDVPRKLKIVDDCLLHDKTILDSFLHTFHFLQTCADNNVTLSEKKFKFCEKEVDFAGFHLG